MLAISKVLTNSLITIGVCAALSTTALAGGNGGSPNGKPFVVINEQIVEVTGAISSLQDQVELLIGRVDSVEQRISASETAVYDLQTNNAAMQALIDANTLSIDGINLVIADLQADIADLQADVAANIGDIADLQSQIVADEALIASLQTAMNLVESGLVDLGANLQDQIDNNITLIGILNSQIAAFESDLAGKQDILNGQCPNGEHLVSVQADGSIVCDPAGGAGSVSAIFSRINTTIVVPVSAGQVLANFVLTCPINGYKSISGGYWSGQDVGAPYMSRAFGQNGWTWSIKNNSGRLQQVFFMVYCARVNIVN